MDGLHKVKKEEIEEKKTKKEKKQTHRMTDTNKVFSVSELKAKLEEDTGLELDNSFKVKKEFLERHNITEEEMVKMMKESCGISPCDEEKKEEEFDYGETDDWVWGYGGKKGDNEYVISISGGGDGVSPNGFEDWVIKKVGGELKYYIRHGVGHPDKEQKGMKLFSCPEGNYVSFQENNSVECYKPREGEMDFEWLEDELEEDFGETRRMSIVVDNLERANKFLQNITEEQTKKIEELKEENGEIMDSLDTAVSNKTRALEEENEKLKKENEAECDENKALKEIIIGLKPQGTYLLSAEAEIKKLQEEIKNIKRSYEVLKSEFQQKRDALQQHNEILMEELCGRPDDEKDKEIEVLRSANLDLKCVLREKKIDWKKVLAEMEDDCRPDAWDCM